MWFCAYLVANGTITWLYRQTFRLPLETSLPYGFLTPLAGVVAAVICALLIDMISRKHWYMLAFLAATLPLTVLAALGATSATEVTRGRRGHANRYRRRRIAFSRRAA